MKPRYIDANALIAKWEDDLKSMEEPLFILATGAAIADVNHSPTADVHENRVGKWLLTDAYPHRLYCDQCYKKMLPNAEWAEAYNIPTKFCPNCGADMRGEKKEHNDE